MPKIYAISDLHLPGGTGKTMDIFGPEWEDHSLRIAAAWDGMVEADDIVLLPGDFSWALKLADTAADFSWLEERPGTKVMVKGNHDLWWSSAAKVRKALPSDIHIIHNDSLVLNGIGFCGSRLWGDPAIQWSREGPEIDTPENAAILKRELHRLELSLQTLPKELNTRIALLHFPPVGSNGEASGAVELLNNYGICTCVFGHLHGLSPEFLDRNPIICADIAFYSVSADYIRFKPILIPYSGI